MRRAITLTTIIITFILGCTSSDDSSSSNESSINPPDWIKGTWLLDSPSQSSGFRFADDDFCSIVLTSTQNCFKESLELTENSGSSSNVTEVIADDTYSIEITLASQIVTYEFKKLSDTQIEWINDPLGELAKTIYTNKDRSVEENSENGSSQETENTFDEDAIYTLNEDAVISVVVGGPPSTAEVIVEIFFEDGTVKKTVSDPNRYALKNHSVDKEAIKAKVRVRNRDTSSNVKFSVRCELSSTGYDYEYFSIRENDILGFSETFHFKKE